MNSNNHLHPGGSGNCIPGGLCATLFPTLAAAVLFDTQHGSKTYSLSSELGAIKEFIGHALRHHGLYTSKAVRTGVCSTYKWGDTGVQVCVSKRQQQTYGKELISNGAREFKS